MGHDALLEGLRVLDLSTMIAGPSAASLLGDYGAEVVKIELPGKGDHVRAFGAQSSGGGLYWKTLSRGKKSVALDLHQVAAQELLQRWIPQFDIVIENFRPGTLERWQLDPAVLRERTPGLIFLRVTAYGQFGPYRDRPGFGTLAEAMTGIAALTGVEGGTPLLPAFPLADIMAGQLGAAAVLAALARRDRIGRGEVIDLAIYEAALKLVELNVMEYVESGIEHQRSGNAFASSAPRGSYQCADDMWIAVSGSTQTIAERVLRTIGGDDLVEDPRFRSNTDRLRNHAELDGLISSWCSARPRATVIDELTKAGCAVGPLESISSMLENPQVVARKSISYVPDDILGQVAMASVFPQFAESKNRLGKPGPSTVGEHTDELLSADLGLPQEALDSLRMTGAIGGPVSS